MPQMSEANKDILLINEWLRNVSKCTALADADAVAKEIYETVKASASAEAEARQLAYARLKVDCGP